MTSFPLDGPESRDGYVDNLYNYLWNKDANTYKTCPGVLLPDTVVYKYRQPAYWFFTSVSDQQIRKKSKQRCNNLHITEVFGKEKRNAKCEIVAYYLSRSDNLDDPTATRPTIEYFDKKGLKAFLVDRTKVNDGILQKFIQPKGKHNFIIRAIWSPRVCLLERGINIRLLHKKSYDMYERAVTYEGPPYYSVQAPIRGRTLPERFEEICRSIEKHVQASSPQRYKIGRMVLNFKIDQQDKIWFLWCSSIRLVLETPHMDKPLKALDLEMGTHPDNVNLDTFSSQPLIKQKTFTCPNCKRDFEKDRVHSVKFKAVIDYYRLHEDDPIMPHAKGVAEEPLDDTRNEVPAIIAKVHPRLTNETYRTIMRDPQFIYKTTVVCEDCYACFTGSSMEVKKINVSTIEYDRWRAEQSSKEEQRRPHSVPPLSLDKSVKINTSLTAQYKKPKKKKKLPPRPHTSTDFASMGSSSMAERHTQSAQPGLYSLDGTSEDPAEETQEGGDRPATSQGLPPERRNDDNVVTVEPNIDYLAGPDAVRRTEDMVPPILIRPSGAEAPRTNIGYATPYTVSGSVTLTPLQQKKKKSGGVQHLKNGPLAGQSFGQPYAANPNAKLHTPPVAAAPTPYGDSSYAWREVSSPGVSHMNSMMGPDFGSIRTKASSYQEFLNHAIKEVRNELGDEEDGASQGGASFSQKSMGSRGSRPISASSMRSRGDDKGAAGMNPGADTSLMDGDVSSIALHETDIDISTDVNVHYDQ